MDRRDFLKSTTGAAVATAASAATALPSASQAAPSAPAIVSGAQELRVALSWPDTGRGPADNARRLGRQIETATEGRYRFTFENAHSTGLDDVSNGLADAYYASENDHLHIHRGFAYFAGLPGSHGLRASTLQAWINMGGGQRLWDGLAGDFGVKAVLAGHLGRSIGLWTTLANSTLAGLAGRQVWVTGLARDVVRGFGAEPSSLTPNEVGKALQQGDLAAMEGGGAIASYSAGLLDRALQPMGASISKYGNAISLGFKRAVWDAMTASDQAIIEAVCTSELANVISEEKVMRQMLLSSFGMTGKDRRQDSETAHTISCICDAVVAHLAATDPATQRINEDLMQFRRFMRPRIRPDIA